MQPILAIYRTKFARANAIHIDWSYPSTTSSISLMDMLIMAKMDKYLTNSGKNTEGCQVSSITGQFCHINICRFVASREGIHTRFG